MSLSISAVERTAKLAEFESLFTSYKGADAAFDDLLLTLSKQFMDANKELALAPAQAREFWQGVLFEIQRLQSTLWMHKNRLSEARLNFIQQINELESKESSSQKP